MLGDPSLLAKTVVEVQGISHRLSGKSYVTKAKHKLDSSGFTVELNAGPIALPGNGRPPSL